LIRAPWSASKVSTALRCPRLYHFKYVDRVPEPEVMPEARIGKAIHLALEKVLQGAPVEEATAAARAELPEGVEQLRFDNLAPGIAPFVQRIGQFRRRRRVVRQMVEFQIAVREDLTVTQFYAGDAYYRGVLDAGYVFDDDTIALVDHKTGVRIPGTSINDQLDGYAVLAQSWLRGARRFWLGVHWVAERAVEWGPPVEPAEVTGRLLPNVLDNIEAAALAIDDGPRTNPGSWCERCSYRTICPASREQRFEPVEWDDSDDE
jgi:hypothetical protein